MNDARPVNDAAHRSSFSDHRSVRLHLGCGPHHLDGWINIDSQPYDGADRVLDVTQGLPFDDVSRIFAEHFIEHLPYADALALLRECRRVLREDGILRLSTPNLAWVWATHYRRVLTAEEEVLACFGINRAFRGWGHQFLYNFGTLRATLLDAGFAEVVACAYGESAHDDLRGLERHERNPDCEDIRELVIVEASGCGGHAPEFLDGPRQMFLRDLAVR
jgi:predicted SAM-dependent methyltransferase